MPLCSICKTKFKPKYSTLEKWCSEDCEYEYNVKQAVKAGLKERLRLAKERKQKDKAVMSAMKERSMTLQDWIKLCQIVFNSFIRLRDKDRECISSGRPLTGKYDAGHFRSAGAYPNLRFEEDNCHGQTVHDNRDKHGNLIEYRERLIVRIGMERFEALEAKKNIPRNYTIPEVKELIQYYRQKIKELK